MRSRHSRIGTATTDSSFEQVKEALKKSEENFSRAFRESPMALTVTSAIDHRYLDVNETFEQITGWRRAEVIGQTPFDIQLWAEPQERLGFVNRLLAGERIRNIEVRFRTRTGEIRTGLGSAGLIEVSREPCALSVIADITDLKRTEEVLRQTQAQLVIETKALRRLSQLSSVLWRAEGLNQGLHEMLSAVIELMGASKGNVALFGEGQAVTVAAHSGFERRYIDAFEQTARETNSAFARALSQCRQVIIRDVEIDELYRPLRPLARQFDYRAVVSTPLVGGHGKLLGIISTYFASPHEPSEEDLRRLDLYAQQAVAFIQRQNAENVVRESEERFRRVANTAPVMIWMSAPDKRCFYFNEPWLEFTGRSLEQEFGDGWAKGVHPEDLDRCLEIYNTSCEKHEPFRMEYRLRRHDGEYRWVLDSGVPRFDAGGSFAGYIGSAIDVTERKKAESALSSVSQKLIEAQEQERRRVARELHDDVNQRLALLAVSLDRLEPQIPASAGKVAQEIREIGKQLADLGIDIQTLSHRLYSSKLEYLGLATSAASFCREFSERHAIQVDFSTEGVPRKLSNETSLSFFRILQEALQNAAKHSRAQNIQVRLVVENGQIHLRVHDSGIGFDALKVTQSAGIGLASMTERMKLIRGNLSIESSSGKGTTVHAYAPMRLEAMSAAAG